MSESDVERANSTLESIEMVHSLLAAEIGLDHLGGALGGQRGTGDGGPLGGRAGASASGIGTAPAANHPTACRDHRGSPRTQEYLDHMSWHGSSMGSCCCEQGKINAYDMPSHYRLLCKNRQLAIPLVVVPTERPSRDATQKDGCYPVWPVRKSGRKLHTATRGPLQSALPHILSQGFQQVSGQTWVCLRPMGPLVIHYRTSTAEPGILGRKGEERPVTDSFELGWEDMATTSDHMPQQTVGFISSQLLNAPG